MVAVALRVAVIAAYPPAFWYRGDSGAYLRLGLVSGLELDLYRPLGYVVFLKMFRPVEATAAVAIAQHLLGLAIAVAAYALLRRRGLPEWLCALAALPIAADPLQLALEHYLLAETLMTALIVAAVLALLWQPAPSTPASAVAGVLLAAAWFTKPSALLVAPVLLGYLLLRSAGRRRVAAFGLGVAVPYLSVMMWLDERPSAYGNTATALYGRVASFADCSRPDVAAALTDGERALCPSPAQRGQRPDWYIWVDGAPGHDHRWSTESFPQMRSFAVKVFAAQPVDYLRVVSREVAAHFLPGVDPGPGQACLRRRYLLPESVGRSSPGPRCTPELAESIVTNWRVSATTGDSTALTRGLAAYSRTAWTGAAVATSAVALTLAAALRRRGNGPHSTASLRRDAGLLASSAVVLIAGPVLIGMHDPRYALPALPLGCLAAALALRYLTVPTGARPGGPRCDQAS